MIRRFRSAITGRFVGRGQATGNRDTTVTETIRKRRAIDPALEGEIRAEIAIGLKGNDADCRIALLSIRGMLNLYT